MKSMSLIQAIVLLNGEKGAKKIKNSEVYFFEATEEEIALASELVNLVVR